MNSTPRRGCVNFDRPQALRAPSIPAILDRGAASRHVHGKGRNADGFGRGNAIERTRPQGGRHGDREARGALRQSPRHLAARCASSTATPPPGSRTSRRTRWCFRKPPKTCRTSCGCARQAPRAGDRYRHRHLARRPGQRAARRHLPRFPRHEQACSRSTPRISIASSSPASRASSSTNSSATRACSSRSTRRRRLARRHGGDPLLRHQCGALRHHEGQRAGAQGRARQRRDHDHRASAPRNPRPATTSPG